MECIFEYRMLGCVEYGEALAVQENLVQKRIGGEIRDQLLLLEHPPVITQGRRECTEDFCSPWEIIKARGIQIVRTDRGGRLTYHGPGQLIGYFICDVSVCGGVRRFVRAIEDVLIKTCAKHGIEAATDPEHPGVWVEDAKVAAVGLHITGGISKHGFALNVNCDLEPYGHIVACGLNGRSVTTMERAANKPLTVGDVMNDILHYTSKVFRRKIVKFDYN